MSVFSSTLPAENLAELLDRLGSIPPERILLRPPPGTATEQDVLVLDGGEVLPGFSLEIRDWFQQAD